MQVCFADRFDSIRRSTFNGSEMELLVVADVPRSIVLDLEVSPGHLYWTERGAVKRSNLDGEDIVTLAVEPSGPLSVAVSSSHDLVVYTLPDGRVMKTDVSGSTPLELDVVTKPDGVVVSCTSARACQAMSTIEKGGGFN